MGLNRLLVAIIQWPKSFIQPPETLGTVKLWLQVVAIIQGPKPLIEPPETLGTVKLWRQVVAKSKAADVTKAANTNEVA